MAADQLIIPHLFSLRCLLFADARTASSRPRLVFFFLSCSFCCYACVALVSLLLFRSSHPQPQLSSPTLSPPAQHSTALRTGANSGTQRPSHHSVCIACLRPWPPRYPNPTSPKHRRSLHWRLHTPLPTSRRSVVSGPPRHIWNGRHPESAKKPPLLDSHTPLWTLFFFFIPVCVDSSCECAPPDHQRALLKVDWACHPLLRIHSYTTLAGPKSPFLVFFTSTSTASTLDSLDIEHVGFDVIASRSSGTIFLKRPCSHELEALCRLTRFALLRHRSFIRPSRVEDDDALHSPLSVFELWD